MSSRQPWFYANGQEVAGPLPQLDLEDLFRLRRLPATTLVWSEGMEAWVAAAELEVFAECWAGVDEAEVQPSSALPEAEPGPADDLRPPGPWQMTPRAVWQPSTPDPWRRFLARQLDVMLVQYAVFSLLPAEPLPGTFTFTSVVLVTATIAVWAVLEGIFLSYLGYTPGKWLMGVMVTDPYGHRLRLAAAWRRSFDVLVRGVGLNIPILVIVAQWLALQRLMQSGITLWDRDGGFVVTHHPVSPWRWLLLLSLLFLLLRSAGVFSQLS